MQVDEYIRQTDRAILMQPRQDEMYHPLAPLEHLNLEKINRFFVQLRLHCLTKLALVQIT